MGGMSVCALDRRLHERARHETFLVIKTAPGDMGSRPLNGPFVSPDITVGADGRPRVVLWNLGTREVTNVVTEFASIPAGMPVAVEHQKIVGHGNPAIIPANSSVTVTCTSIWPRLNTADVLVVTASHDQDLVKAVCDPLADRHVGQMNYAWAGTFEGKCDGSMLQKVAVQIRPANRGLYRVKLFTAVGTRLPSNPQIDRTMAPNGAGFRWMETYPGRKEIWDLTMLDNQRVTVVGRTRFTDEAGRPDEELKGLMLRN